MPADWIRKVRPRLPIASSVESGTLDILLLKGEAAASALDDETCRRLLVETTLHLHILTTPQCRIPRGPLLFIGDRSAIPLARARLQEAEPDQHLLLIENEFEASSPLGSILSMDCYQSHNVNAVAKLTDDRRFVRQLEAQRQMISSLIDRGGHIIIAGASGHFHSIVGRNLRHFLGERESMFLANAGRLTAIET